VWISEQEGHLNLGCYHSPLDAARASLGFINRGIVPAHLLPKWVRRIVRYRPLDDRSVVLESDRRRLVPHTVEIMYFARVTRRGVTLRTDEHETPEGAQEELREMLRRKFGQQWASMPCAVSRERMREQRFAQFAQSVQRHRPRRRKIQSPPPP
jgi:hypothetical protein